jgi:two-component system C4-dicarboxylate transport response regulator DctD
VDLVLKGETGAGKDMVARALHDFSGRKNGPFVAVNCGALPENLVDSAFFGHERGAFTGAEAQHKGYFEAADGGTLFLDELESMPLNFQTRLLRVLENREITRLGSDKKFKLNFRVVAAVKGALDKHVKAGVLRSDLVFRLNVGALEIPALRERRQDIEQLFIHFAERAAVIHNRPVPALRDNLRAQISRYDWPGNVRELKNAAERFVIGLPLNFQTTAQDEDISIGALDEAVDDFEKAYILKALRQAGGAVGVAAELLNIPRKKLYLRMKKHKIDKNYTD